MKRKSRRHPQHLKRLTPAEIAKHARRALRPSYRVECFYKGFNWDLDRKLKKLARRPQSDSGMLMAASLRDVGFTFASKASAIAAVKRIKNGAPDVRAMTRFFEKA